MVAKSRDASVSYQYILDWNKFSIPYYNAVKGASVVSKQDSKIKEFSQCEVG